MVLVELRLRPLPERPFPYRGTTWEIGGEDLISGKVKGVGRIHRHKDFAADGSEVLEFPVRVGECGIDQRIARADLLGEGFRLDSQLAPGIRKIQRQQQAEHQGNGKQNF